MNSKIFVCTYNEHPVISNELYIPIQVGAANNSEDICFLKDNMGEEHISSKNSYYSEQSAVYWVWKNIKDVDYVGFCHYRKMLCLTDITSYDKCDITMPSEEWISAGNMDVNIDILMQDCDIIMVNQMNLKKHKLTVFEQYCKHHVKEDLLLVENIIKRDYPEYINAWNTVMYSADAKFHPYNTYIMKWEFFDKWCTFIFDIFEKMESRIGLEYHIGYQTRVFGYLAERILDVFVKKNKMRIKTRPIALFKDFFSDEKIQAMKDDIELGKTKIREIKFMHKKSQQRARQDNEERYIATGASWNTRPPEYKNIRQEKIMRRQQEKEEQQSNRRVAATQCTNYINVRSKHKKEPDTKIHFV